MPGREELPSTLRRSPKQAQKTWIEAHDSAVESYGEGERSHRTAYAALKHSFEKVGDHWEPKRGGRKGPSDQQAKRSTPSSRRAGRTAGGFDASAPKTELMDIAKRLDIRGRSRMTKDELIATISKANRTATARARRSGRR
jgi:hypothetical protein